ncbi:MAG: hypothetical protein V3U71_01680 [Cocleimonas sp.]
MESLTLNSSLKSELSLSDFKLNNMQKIRERILHIYFNKGETKKSIEEINHFWNHICSQHSVNTRLNDYDLPCYQHRCIKLIDEDIIKLALHIMPKGTEIPMHAHPEKLALTYVINGSLAINNQSRFDLFSLRSGHLTKILNSGNSSVALPILDNLHQIKALSDRTIFLSLRMTVTKTKKNSNLSPKKTINSIVSTLLLSTLTSSVSVFANDSLHQPIQTSVQDRKPITQKSVTLLRESNNYEDRCNAVRWYQETALLGNAESQYWLGIMFLKGSGITEDEDEAMQWISLAAKQGHKNAEKLLNHLLERTPEFDC